MPLRKAKVQNYERGENINFMNPCDRTCGVVFEAYEDLVSLRCDWNVLSGVNFIGVIPCVGSKRMMLKNSFK